MEFEPAPPGSFFDLVATRLDGIRTLSVQEILIESFLDGKINKG